MSEAAEPTLPEQIRNCLRDLAPIEIDIEDQSAAHAGHAGARSGAHFRLRVVSEALRVSPACNGIAWSTTVWRPCCRAASMP